MSSCKGVLNPLWAPKSVEQVVSIVADLFDKGNIRFDLVCVRREPVEKECFQKVYQAIPGCPLLEQKLGNVLIWVK